MPRKDDVVWYLDVERTEADDVTIVSAEGRVSDRTAPDLQRKLAEAVDESHRDIVLDLSAVDYISSAGLRVLEQIAGRLGSHGQRLVVCQLQDPVHAALALAGRIPHMTIERSRESAMAAVLATRS